jgi:hypothetical protein
MRAWKRMAHNTEREHRGPLSFLVLTDLAWCFGVNKLCVVACVGKESRQTERTALVGWGKRTTREWCTMVAHKNQGSSRSVGLGGGSWKGTGRLAGRTEIGWWGEVACRAGKGRRESAGGGRLRRGCRHSERSVSVSVNKPRGWA